ncbi:MAG: LacI family DNA-binding transcriptional regulator [Sedimentisphaerales bacterium]|nr:LacI family DNA-binding transcriptional regulator [Sedimentisphaerales bacterium]
MTKKQKMSLKQIAEATNLSITTVSRVLRNRGDISEKTRERVLKVAREMNYRPNLLIHGIQTGRTRNVGIMVPPFNPFWSDVLKGIHDELVKSDYAPITLWEDASLERADRENFMLKQMHRLIDRRVDGVILWPKVSEVYGTHLDELESRDLPVVTIDHELDFADSVITDEKLGAERVARHLYRLGHRRMGHLASDGAWSWARLRRKFFEESVAELEGATCQIVESSLDEDVPDTARELLLSQPRPTAIFAFSDWVAFEIYKVAEEMEIKIPDDLSIVGYSDTHKIAQLINPPLTTVRQMPREMGAKSAEILLDRINGKLTGTRTKHVKMGCELIVRRSTAKI